MVAPLIGIILFVASTVYSLMSQITPGPDERKKGFGNPGDFNVSDGTDPIGIGYGMPMFDAPVLFDYLKPESVNSRRPADDVRRYVGLSLGGANVAGLDGRDVHLTLNDVPLFEIVGETSPESAQTLTEKPNTGGRVWLFPQSNVVRDSVVLTVDGVVVHAGDKSGTEPDATVSRQFTAQRTSVKVFTNDGHDGSLEDDNIGTFKGVTEYAGSKSARRVGGLLPLDGIPDGPASVGIYFTEKVNPDITGLNSGLVNSIGTLPAEAVHIGTLNDDRRYFWVSSDKAYNATQKGRPWLSVHVGFGLNDDDLVSHFKFTGKVRPRIKLVPLDDGGMEAHFPESQTGNEVKWTGKTSTFQDEDVAFHFRDGSPDQEPVPFENGGRNSYPVGAELPQGTVATYTTKNKVHNFVVGIESGGGGFFDVSKSSGRFGEISRSIKVRVREDGAPDGSADDTKQPRSEEHTSELQSR